MRQREARSSGLARRLRGTLTEAERILWSQLRKHSQPGALFRRQHPVGPYIADFACIAARLVIEVDGATHSEDEEIARDARRTDWLEGQGWQVMRVTNDEVRRELNAVLRAIMQVVERRVKELKRK